MIGLDEVPLFSQVCPGPHAGFWRSTSVQQCKTGQSIFMFKQISWTPFLSSSHVFLSCAAAFDKKVFCWGVREILARGVFNAPFRRVHRLELFGNTVLCMKVSGVSVQDTNESFTLAKLCKYIPIHVHYVLMAGSSSSSWAHVPVFAQTRRYVMDSSTVVVVITLYMSTTPK